MTSPSVEVRDVTKAFGRGPEAVRVLNDVSVSVHEREFFTLLGPSGCGKTTLLRLIAGFEEASAGEIRISGALVNHLPPFKRRVNTVFQSYALFPHLSVEQNVAFGLDMQDLTGSERERRTREALELVQMAHLAKRRPAQLSGGQQQRVALARALAPRPDVLLLDEPLSALDLKLRKEMQIELKQLQSDAGITFIFVTHDQEEALTMSDRIAVMHGGNILQIGAPIDIYERPQHRFVADFIGDSNFLTGPVSTNGQGGLRVNLANAGSVPCPATVTAPSGNITLAIRPERALIVPSDSSDRHLAAEIAQVVYLGTATLYQLRLGNGQTFSVRQGNITGGRQPLAIGSPVGIALPADALNVVEA